MSAKHKTRVHSKSIFASARILACIAFAAAISACGGGGGGGTGGIPIQPTPTERTSAPTLSVVGQFNTPGQSRGLLRDGNLLYIADGAAGLDVVQLPEHGQPYSIGALALLGEGRAYSVQKKDNYLYLTTRNEGIYVIDVSNPTFPVLVTVVVTPSDATYSSLVGDRLYVTASAHFLIFDVSDATNPVLVSATESSSPLLHLEIKDNLAYVAAYNRGLLIFDIANESSPTLLSTTGLDFNAAALEANGDVVIVGGNATLAMVNITDATAPSVVATFPIEQLVSQESSISDLVLNGEFLYVAASTGGVIVVDVSRPTDMIVVGSQAHPPESAFGLISYGRTLIVADGTFGVQILDIFATTDIDGDQVPDGADAFPSDAAEWDNTDGDSIGNNADTDDDNDGFLDDEDDFPLNASEWLDTDGDDVGDNSDAFVSDNSEWLDTDMDSIGNNADPDDDNDGKLDAEDELPTDSLNRIRVTFDGYGNSYPNLDGNMISWRGYESNSTPRVLFKDLTTDATQSLSDDLPGFIGIPSPSNGQVAWRTYDSETHTMSIYLWDGFSRRMITEYPAGKFDMPWGYPPSYHSVDVILDDGQIAWAGWDGSDYEIYFWDGNVIHQITDNAVDDFEAQLNNGQIAWTGEEEANGDWDIFYWDGSVIINVSNRPGKPDEDAHLMNGTIAWSGYTTTEFKRDIFFWDGTETTTINVVGNDYEPQIDNTSLLVTWHSVGADDRYSIYVWNGTQAVQMLPPSDFTVKTPFANEGRIAWVGYSEIGADIYIGTPHFNQ